jgi:ParB/RepB/Spo0J family partition protein
MQIQTINLDSITQKDLASYDETRKLVKRGKDIFKVSLENIRIRVRKGKNFNHRKDFGHLAELAEGIRESKGTDPIKGDLLSNGLFVLSDGERRYRAYIILSSQNIPGFDTMDAITNPAKYTDTDRYISQYTSNNSKNFQDLEEADYFKTLIEEENLSQGEIARRTGRSKQHVSNQLRLVNISEEEREMIRRNEIAPTTILDLIKKGHSKQDRLDVIKTNSTDTDGKKKKLKVKDVADLMLGTEPDQLDANTTPSDILKELLISVKALDRLIGTDSRMSNITFKMDNRIRHLQRLVKEKRLVFDGNDGHPF